MSPKRLISPKCLQVVKLFSENWCEKEIASKLGLSRKAVEYHLASARARLGLNSRVLLVHWALKHRVAKWQVK